MNITYIANVRLPTERAHGLQIMKMCEAFVRSGARVEVVTPQKRHIAQGGGDPFAFYKVDRVFNVRKVFSLDLLGLTERHGRLFYWLDMASFLFRLYFLRPEAGSVLYAREPLLLLPFSSRHYRLCVETHDIPRSRLFLRALKRAHRIIVITTHLKTDLVAAGMNSENILVAPDGVDLAEFVTEDTHAARRTVGLPQESRIVLYTGHFFSWKGVDVLARASRDVRDALFVFVGGVEPELSRFREAFGIEPNIRIVPYVPHETVRHYLNAADVLVLPNSASEKVSVRYTSPMKLFEYMAAQKPIVASDLPSIRDILDSSTAILVRPDEPDALAAGIREAFEIEASKKRAQEAYRKVLGLTWGKRAVRILQNIAKAHV